MQNKIIKKSQILWFAKQGPHNKVLFFETAFIAVANNMLFFETAFIAVANSTYLQR